MADKKAGLVEVEYIGPPGNINYDIAAYTGGDARLATGQAVRVSEELADRLTASADWIRRTDTGGKGAKE